MFCLLSTVAYDWMCVNITYIYYFHHYSVLW